MCFLKHVYHHKELTTKDILKNEQFIAQNDITVYKVIREQGFFFYKRYFSEIRNFKYKRHKQYETKIDIECRRLGYDKDNKMYDYSVSADSGFYSYEESSIPIIYDPMVLAEFTIPKGAVYYFDEINRIYISNKIIFNKVIKVHN